METSLRKDDTQCFDENELLAMAAGLPQVVAQASQCAQHAQVSKSLPQDATLGDMEQQVVVLTAQKNDLSRSQRRQLAKLVDKIKLKKALLRNNLDLGVPSELSARMDAIKPIVDAKLRGVNSSGSARALRNLAVHDFSINFSDVTPDNAQALQRKRNTTSKFPKKLEDEQFNPVFDTDLIDFAVDCVNLAACLDELADSDLSLELLAVKELIIATYRKAASLADVIEDIELECEKLDDYGFNTVLSECTSLDTCPVVGPITDACKQEISTHLCTLALIGKFSRRLVIDSAVQSLASNFINGDLLWIDDGSCLGYSWLAQCTCDLEIFPCDRCHSNAKFVRAPEFLLNIMKSFHVEGEG